MLFLLPLPGRLGHWVRHGGFLRHQDEDPPGLQALRLVDAAQADTAAILVVGEDVRDPLDDASYGRLHLAEAAQAVPLVLEVDQAAVGGIPLGILFAHLHVEPVIQVGDQTGNVYSVEPAVLLASTAFHLLDRLDQSLAYVSALDVRLPSGSDEPEALADQGGVAAAEDHVAGLDGSLVGRLLGLARHVGGLQLHAADATLGVGLERFEVGDDMLSLPDDGLTAAAGDSQRKVDASLRRLLKLPLQPSHRLAVGSGEPIDRLLGVAAED